jgi:hypothetical protein
MSSPEPPPDRFRNPTLLELFVLVGAAALALVPVQATGIGRQLEGLHPLMILLLVAVLLTLWVVIATPTVLLTQHVVRGRSEPLSVAERFGLISVLFWTPWLIVTIFRPGFALVGQLAAPLQIFAGLVALLDWFVSVLGHRVKTRLRWTDQLCWATGVAISGWVVFYLAHAR